MSESQLFGAELRNGASARGTELYAYRCASLKCSSCLSPWMEPCSVNPVDVVEDDA